MSIVRLRYYDYRELESSGLNYVKIMTMGHEIPKRPVIRKKFMKLTFFLNLLSLLMAGFVDFVDPRYVDPDSLSQVHFVFRIQIRTKMIFIHIPCESV